MSMLLIKAGAESTTEEGAKKVGPYGLTCAGKRGVGAGGGGVDGTVVQVLGNVPGLLGDLHVLDGGKAGTGFAPCVVLH